MTYIDHVVGDNKKTQLKMHVNMYGACIGNLLKGLTTGYTLYYVYVYLYNLQSPHANVGWLCLWQAL